MVPRDPMPPLDAPDESLEPLPPLDDALSALVAQEARGHDHEPLRASVLAQVDAKLVQSRAKRTQFPRIVIWLSAASAAAAIALFAVGGRSFSVMSERSPSPNAAVAPVASAGAFSDAVHQATTVDVVAPLVIPSIAASASPPVATASSHPWAPPTHVTHPVDAVGIPAASTGPRTMASAVASTAIPAATTLLRQPDGGAPKTP